jgi:cullin-associated NEDD8-dissociated protein 1
MLNMGLHFHPALMGTLLDKQDVLPKLYRTLDLYQKRVVDLGPFKHRVDDALPLRKAALVCIDTLLGTASLSAKLDVTQFMERAQKLLGDNDEVKVQMYGVLRKLCTHNATAVANQLGELVEPLQKTIQPKKSLPEGTGPEVERAWDVVKAACRLIVELNGVNMRIGIVCRPWSDFYDRAIKVEKIGPIITGFVEGS